MRFKYIGRHVVTKIRSALGRGLGHCFYSLDRHGTIKKIWAFLTQTRLALSTDRPSQIQFPTLDKSHIASTGAPIEWLVHLIGLFPCIFCPMLYAWQQDPIQHSALRSLTYKYNLNLAPYVSDLTAVAILQGSVFLCFITLVIQQFDSGLGFSQLPQLR